MERGERVLIHAGTGGVGLAAVQLALQAGAVVFATAGSPEKRELLTALGVPHVMDSRSLAFADEIRKLTNGEGVDIVLNSLSGEAIDKSLSLLRPYGRFIEIGKTDIFKNRKIGMRALRRNISVFVADLLGALGARADLARSMLQEVIGRVESGSLRPLPHRVFPAARVADAFRSMAQAKHIGKLIVSMQDNEGLVVDHGLRSVTVAAEGSYLITGGLGGLGLAVADRLARRGARHLALVGRSAPRRPRRPRWRAYASAASRCSSSRRTSPIASRRARSSPRSGAGWDRCAASCTPPWFWTMRRSNGSPRSGCGRRWRRRSWAPGISIP